MGYSSSGHGNTHTPSSGGSLTRYSSLTTPFYRVPLPRQQIVPVQRGFTPSGGTTPTNMNVDTPTGLIYMPMGAGSQTSGFHSNSSNRRRSDNSLPLFARSPPLPFGKLLYHQPHPQPPSNSSLSTSPHSYSSSSLYRHKSTSLSPHSTPPSANLPSPVGGSGRTVGHGFKYSLTPHGSSTKLSSLAEEAEKVGSSSGDRSSSGGGGARPTKGKSQPIKVEEKSLLRGNLITQSCLLNSDGELDMDGEDDENFPLSLSMNSSFGSELGQQISMATGTTKNDSVHTITYQSNDAVRFTVRSPERVTNVRPASAKESDRRPKSREGRTLQRASSFSQQRSHRLTNDLADIRQRACSLSAHGDPLDPNFTANSLLMGTNGDLEVSPSEIVAFKLPFLFSSSPGSQGLISPSLPSSREDSVAKIFSSSPQQRRGSWDMMGVEEWEESSSSCLATLKQSYILGRELLTMARARQGPIMLLSTELVSLLNCDCTVEPLCFD